MAPTSGKAAIGLHLPQGVVMVKLGTLQDGLRNRRKLTLANGTGYFKSESIISEFGVPFGPHAFLVEQDPDSVILPHFHVENEFQLVVQGGGLFGRTTVAPLTVHYAGAFTGYGPITASAEGLWYFTLRANMESGALFLPEARDRMPRNAPKRHLLGNCTVQDAGLPCEAAETRAIIEPQPDGIAAWLLRLPAGRSLQSPVHPGGKGRCYFVCAGALQWGDAELGRWSSVFVSADEEPVTLVGGAAGAAVLALQYPL